MKAVEMLLDPRDDRAEPLARALVRAMEPVAAELRLVNVADFIAYVREEKFANIQDIVNSSVELFFKPGTLSFGWGAEVEVDWNSTPVVALDMEFRHHSVWLVFKLILRALETDVMIEHVSLPKTAGHLRGDLGVLTGTIADARRSSHNNQIIPK
jgi:hypothetical protein